ncbi:MBL fold metallo-hydrolase [Aquimarina pacifica]|uniref:MBL fold metallo-hydrolase n=1 Tax=Aquimarina pacifica TaxID=1296415 RepID=UPI0004729296|nr:MBL fold metallo-hydrolase [Aquimarina pacifica]
MLIFFVLLIVVLIVLYFLFVKFYPSFGGDMSEKSLQQYATSENYKEGRFVNKQDVPKDLGFSEMMGLAYTFFTTKVPKGRPKDDLQVQKVDSTKVADYNGDARLIWYGHSAFLLQIENKNILLDPMFGKVAAPHPWLGENRFNKEMPLTINKLPQIDAVIISHDHYDHLDYESIIKLKEKVKRYFVPLGVGIHLEAWGIDKNQIVELDWWQETLFDDLKLVCTPAQHFSGRKIGKNQTTLWSSWVIQSQFENIFFSGDGGYGKHFSEIGAKYGPFDIGLMECGQYNEKWADIHCMPEETAQAGVDVQAKKIMPIHWAGFKLALHSWTDPIIRVRKKSNELNLPMIAPKIGQPVIVKDSTTVYQDWWDL